VTCACDPGPSLFETLLIANRGEIACRIIKTARRLGLRTIAVYSEADRGALHVEMADEALPIGPPPARQSYLKIEAILEAAQRSGAQAVHPGYGFLSENADFAAACEKEGVVFVGPSAAAIALMGSKAAARALMAEHEVPIVPGYHGEDQAPSRLEEEARRLGFPVLLKASGGGGGRGMRVVRRREDFARALEGARREAAQAFGDDRVLLEKYLLPARHIEVQIFADRFGHVLHLFERECSIQRRYQKLVEEAPAPGLSEERRYALAEAAIRAARASRYLGAGTVEFLVTQDAFYFMEMNTRLQVEHPVTEMIAGVDLVEWQLRVAAGEALPLAQEDLRIRGHAIEARLYAEDPARGFLPQSGRLLALSLPPPELARVDSGVRAGDVVTPYYDAMLAKIIVCGEDRAAALARLSRALGESALFGVKTNLSFLARLVVESEFAAGRYDTGFVERRLAPLSAPAKAPIEVVLAAALSRLLRRGEAAQSAARASPDPFTPWARADGWRACGKGEVWILFAEGDEVHRVKAASRAEGWALRLGERVFAAAARRQEDGALAVVLDGRHERFRVFEREAETAVFAGGESWQLALIDPLASRAGADPTAGRLSAPMPGRVSRLFVRAGKRVRRGEPLLVIEAMKMEHWVTAPADGVIESVRFEAGDVVEEGAELVVLSAREG
jgi:3-methylcrotonyl-CoA carboxylase alpha subunit